VFPIHRSVRFHLITATRGSPDSRHCVPSSRTRSGRARDDRGRATGCFRVVSGENNS
jgi:hypothetical protein